MSNNDEGSCGLGRNIIEFVNFRSSNSNDLNHSSDADLRS